MLVNTRSTEQYTELHAGRFKTGKSKDRTYTDNDIVCNLQSSCIEIRIRIVMTMKCLLAYIWHL